MATGSGRSPCEELEPDLCSHDQSSLPLDAQPDAQRLPELLLYLRERHAYCLYCATVQKRDRALKKPLRC